MRESFRYQSNLHETEPLKYVSDYVVVLPKSGIGDGIAVGLTVIDQIVQNEPDSSGGIDVVCNPAQEELFLFDPRVNLVITSPEEDADTFVRSNHGQAYHKDKNILTKLFSYNPDRQEVLDFLRSRNYVGVFPADGVFSFSRKIGTHVMYPNLFNFVRDIRSVQNFASAPLPWQVRKTVNRNFFHLLTTPHPHEDVSLYTHSKYIKESTKYMQELKKHGDREIIVVAPDTSSLFTRPTTKLLAEGLESAAKDLDFAVVILPSYTDEEASGNLYEALSSMSGQTVLYPDTPVPSLHFLAGLIDQADLFISGDTGVMHLATAKKVFGDEVKDPSVRPRNATKIISLFGATNPNLYGYRQKAVILGEGRVEQASIQPGLFKAHASFKSEIDYFDHIDSTELTAAILEQLN